MVPVGSSGSQEQEAAPQGHDEVAVAGGILMSAQTRVLIIVMSCVCIVLVFALIIHLLMSFIL